MTLIAGALLGDTAYIVADSAVTYEIQAFEGNATTATGEQVGDYAVGWVHDGAWKLLRVGNDAVVAFMGQEKSVLKAARAILESYGVKKDLGQALQAAADDGTRDGDFSAIGGWLNRGRPAVHVCVAGADTEAVPDGRVAVLPTQLLDRVASFPANVPERGAEFLACLIAYLQTASTVEGWMDRGIGGMFSGALIDGSGMHWQPDIQFHRSSGTDLGPPHSSIVRSDHWIVGTSVVRPGVTRFHPNPPSDAYLSNWNRFHYNYYDYGRFEYYAFCDTDRQRTTVVEMHKHHHGPGLHVENDGLAQRLHFDTDLREAIERPGTGAHGLNIVAMDRDETGHHPGSFTAPIGAFAEIDWEIDSLFNTQRPDVARCLIDEAIRISPTETKYDEQ